MKFIRHVLSIILILACIIFALIFSAQLGYLNTELKYLTEYYLKFKGHKAKIHGFSYKDKHIKVKQLQLYQNNLRTEINNLDIDIKWNLNSWNDFFSADTKHITMTSLSDNIKIISDIDNQIILQSNLSAEYQYSFRSDDADFKLTMQNLDLSEDYNFKNGSLKYQYHSKNLHHNHDLNLLFENNKFIQLSTEIDDNNKVIASAEIKDMPIILYKIGNSFIKDNQILTLANKLMKGGEVTYGKIDVNLDEEFYRTSILKEHNIKGNLKVINASISYFETLPIIENMNFDVELSGSKTHINVTEAVNSGIVLYDGKIDMDFQGIDDTILYISAKGRGAASGLINFINASALDKLKKSNIDLTKIKGDTEATIDISIPLKKKTPNTYNIKAKINNVYLAILKDQIKLTNATLQGGYFGDKIVVSGVGMVNKIRSDLDFVYYLSDDKDNYHELNVISHVKASDPVSFMPNLSEIVMLDNGHADIHTKYYFKNQIPYIQVSSDLNNIEVFIAKLGVHKKNNNKAKFFLSGQFQNIDQGTMSFSLIGGDDLKIQGIIDIDQGELFLHLPQIIHNNTNVKAKTIITKSGSVSANLKGSILDLSQSNMLDFLKKQRSGGETELNIKVNELKLKNNVWLNDFKLYIQCDNNRCFNGYISSNIGKNTLTAKLSLQRNEETWNLNIGNAGAFLKAIGAYDLMKVGRLHLIVSTKRKAVHTGKIIPILDGKFEFTNFKLTNTPVLTKIVSFASLPGLVSLVASNQDLVFAKMSGKFSFINNILYINESFAEGPYFNFSLQGKINFNTRIMELSGHVIPALFGINKVINKVPIIGRIISGTKKSQGITSAPFTIKDSF